MWVTKLLISQVKKKDFLPQNDPIWPKIGIFGPGLAGSFGALLVGWLKVVARGLYLARHLFTFIILHRGGLPNLLHCYIGGVFEVICNIILLFEGILFSFTGKKGQHLSCILTIVGTEARKSHFGRGALLAA